MKPVKKIRISAVLATHNEAANLARCLDSVAGLADEIVIVDGESQDNTVEIAKKYHARVISRPNLANFHINKRLAIDEAKGDWILQLDADEAVSPQLAQEILAVTGSADAANGYWIPRLNYFIGRFLTKGGQYPDYTLRLYRKGKGNLPAIHVHEQAEVEGPVGHLKSDLLHYGDPVFENYLHRFNRYSTLLADELVAKKQPVTVAAAFNYLFLKPPATFIKIYVRHKGFVDGFPGFVFALFSGLIHAVTFIKVWQKTTSVS